VQHEAVASYSPASASMICASRSVPSVAIDQRLRLAAGEQRRAVGARQHADLRISIGRTVRVSRPSMRGSPVRIWLRTIARLDLEQQRRRP
jgi:hypothetical protein